MAQKIFEFQLALWASNFPTCPNFSNSLIIHKPQNSKLFSGMFDRSNLFDLLVFSVALISFICCFLY